MNGVHDELWQSITELSFFLLVGSRCSLILFIFDNIVIIINIKYEFTSKLIKRKKKQNTMSDKERDIPTERKKGCKIC